MEKLKMEIGIETTFIPLILAYDDLPKGVTLIRQPVMERRMKATWPSQQGY
jgi:hypothetical protein